MQRKNKFPYVIIAILSVLLVVTVFQSFQISTLSSEIRSVKITGRVTGTAGSTSTSSATSGSGTSNTLQQILEEITPTGTPDYGTEAGVSYDKVEEGLKTLMGYHQTISLGDDEEQRYIDIATSQGTACEFCCGIGERGFGTSDGRIACGCSHNMAFSGLTKWLIKNTGYTDQQIIDEIHKWKVLFFPQGAVKKELEKRNIQPESVGLPSMVGGC